MIISISWKNVWRNKTRSLVVVCAVLLGMFGGIMAVAIMNGWIAQRTHDVIYKEIAHVQVHDPDYMNNEEVGLTIKGFGQLVHTLDTMADVEGYSARVKVFAMVQSDWSATGAMVMGIDPQKEKSVSEIYQSLIEGAYFESSGAIPPVVIGSKMAEDLKLRNYQVTPEKTGALEAKKIPAALAEKLSALDGNRYRTEKEFREALNTVLDKKEMERYEKTLTSHYSFYRLGARVSLTLQTAEGHLVTPVFRVRGIYKTSNTMFDGMNVFVDKNILSQHLGLGDNEVHEIAVISSGGASGHLLAEKLASAFPSLSVMSWKQISPEVAMYTDFGRLFNYFYIVIILFALAFGIINTMLMSVLERVKELGMLMAIGMNRLRVFAMIMLESVFLTLTGAAFGIGISGALVTVLQKTGINFGMWAEGFEAMGYAPVVYPFVDTVTFVGIMLLVILTGMLAALWPARKALKLNPAEAIRSDM